MCGRLMNCILCVGVIAASVAVLGTEAEAAICTSTKTRTDQTCTSWKTLSSGTKFCTLWCTGSEICDNVITGMSGALLKECESTNPDPTKCPVTTCSVFGTFGSDPNCADPTIPGSEDDNCEIEGVAFCLNPVGKYNVKGTAFNLPLSLIAVAGNTACIKAGKCTNFAELDPDPVHSTTRYRQAAAERP